ncbi:MULTISPECIES: lysoplasmalogenase [unclassified Wenzhouxiangella]|uniref:lysoplasmalogenase n=1 Tax=unclassified Wenzhouxiangella TaxID=2613841 RepID=UPI002163125F|nr:MULTISPECIES: lysoplasmalogenase [unclassified Wenzhouxiangella]
MQSVEQDLKWVTHARLAFAIIAATYWLTLWLPPLPGSWILKFTPMLIAAAALAILLKPAAAVPMAIGFVAAAGGDIFLAFDRNHYFTSGLACFLVTQIAYSMAFVRHRRTFMQRWPWWLPVIAFGLTVLALMWPSLGNDRIPVAVYVAALVFMAVSATTVEKRPGRLFAGAALFVVSDALIGITRFVADFSYSVQIIIAIYALAQYLIFTGAIEAMPKRLER